MYDVEGHTGRDCRAAREIERFERDALVRAFAVHHIEEAEEGQADLLAALRRPEEAAGERAGAEVEFAGEVRKLRLPQIERFAIDGNRRHQPFRRGNHEVRFVDDALIGAAQLLHIIDAIGIRSAKAIDMTALIKAAAHADAFIAQREDGFTHARVGGVEALLNDLPRVYLEIYVSGFCHCASSCRFFLFGKKEVEALFFGIAGCLLFREWAVKQVPEGNENRRSLRSPSGLLRRLPCYWVTIEVFYNVTP